MQIGNLSQIITSSIIASIDYKSTSFGKKDKARYVRSAGKFFGDTQTMAFYLKNPFCYISTAQ
ncbi:MAG: hypothetical protein NPIRA06_00620 [Nitrospirales bacterium]|nr:MAG: hypothetical protein NPIRA06_00620 [Nitrospirales bacterium]